MERKFLEDLGVLDQNSATLNIKISALWKQARRTENAVIRCQQAAGGFRPEWKKKAELRKETGAEAL